VRIHISRPDPFDQPIPRSRIGLARRGQGCQAFPPDPYRTCALDLLARAYLQSGVLHVWACTVLVYYIKNAILEVVAHLTSISTTLCASQRYERPENGSDSSNAVWCECRILIEDFQGRLVASKVARLETRSPHCILLQRWSFARLQKNARQEEFSRLHPDAARRNY